MTSPLESVADRHFALLERLEITSGISLILMGSITRESAIYNDSKKESCRLAELLAVGGIVGR